VCGGVDDGVAAAKGWPGVNGPSAAQKLLIVMLAVASVGTTLLVAMSVLRRQAGDPPDVPPLRGGPVSDPGQPLPVLRQLPGFTLTERDDEPFGSADLAGKVWIASFIFTRCTGPCPMLTSRMAELQMAMKDSAFWPDVRLVSFSVDPAFDTPAVLAERARIAHADPEHWLWLTGSREQVWSLVKEGFGLHVGESDDPSSPIVHSQKLALIDRGGRIRGYYDGLDGDDLGRLAGDLERLVAEPYASGSSPGGSAIGTYATQPASAPAAAQPRP
jgi:protein SCO1/2